ncbi:MAG: UDP-N-acetyl-D-mannosamine dehydrogenase [Planctomycetes bacterium]|nr:UDP-N-acetyl-D-mannosamine dehydrogenase [Planctomycetota bacterium]
MATDTATANATTNASAPQVDLSRTQIRKRAPTGERRRSFRTGPELRVCVVGLGYIGLPTASLLGTKGCQVHGVDVSPDVVETINAGRIHIEEPDLDLLVKSAVQAGRLKAHHTPVEADVFVLAVPTPIMADKQPDLTMVEAAARSILPVVRKGNLVILESTSPVGTTDGVVARILREAGHNVGEEVFVAYCPERVLPGRILTELVENDRIVGGVNDNSTEVALEFYQSFVRGEVIGTDSRSAEMVKLSENSFRDVNIAFANELSMICARAGISVWEVIRLANRHPRVNILQPGPGVGGHCIAVDPWFIVASDPSHARLIRAAREVNDHKPHWVIERVRQCASQVREPVIACLGLSFKADVDDLRESPAAEIVRELQRANLGELLIVEPHLLFHPEFELTRLEDAVAKANIVLVLVDHKPFKKLRREALHEKLLIDTRGLYL